MIDLFVTLEKLAQDLNIKSQQAPTKAATAAYLDAANLLIAEIAHIKSEIERKEEMKIAAQLAKFDEHHNNYAEILKRGHIGIPDETHAELSEFTLGRKTASEVFNNLSEDCKNEILSTLASDKGMNEQLTAHRHQFHFIKHTQGHDGIRPCGKVYEVKNRTYVQKKERTAAVIKFDRVSVTNAKKLREGRPEIIFNITDKHKVLVEMRVEFGDKLLDLYDKKVDELKYSKTSGFDISFKDFKDHIIEITHVSPELYTANLQKNFIEFVQAAV